MTGIADLTVGHLQDGEVIYEDPVRGIRKIAYKIDDKHTAIKTEYLVSEDFLSQNAEDRNNSLNTRWGEGKMIGRIPFHLYHDKENGLAAAINNQDQAYVRRFLNENSKFKTRDKI